MQKQLQDNNVTVKTRAGRKSLLAGLLFDETGELGDLSQQQGPKIDGRDPSRQAVPPGFDPEKPRATDWPSIAAVAGYLSRRRNNLPPALVVISLLPMLVGHHSLESTDPERRRQWIGAMISIEFPIAVLAGITVAWLRFQEQVHSQLKEATGGAFGE